MDLTEYDLGGRRSGIERRQFTYMFHIPERRSGKDRRSGFDRRAQKSEKLQPALERRRVYTTELFSVDNGVMDAH